jgi:hypothetical protein
VTRTVGLPGTGIFYTSRSRKHTGVHSSKEFAGRSGTTERAKLLRKLDELHGAGLLTDAEYEQKQHEVNRRFDS